MTHPEDTFTGFTHHSKSFRDQVFQHFTFRQTLTELIGFRLQLLISQFLDFRFHAVDQVNHFTHAAQCAVVTATKNFGQ
ncbi:hypothetical protein SRABI106_02395 [Rahnella aquatilis]|nr:hypothetical protein SRABI106_02395 [Rahnella aquatilis]